MAARTAETARNPQLQICPRAVTHLHFSLTKPPNTVLRGCQPQGVRGKTPRAGKHSEFER
eukprot:scaffold80485_cov65-Phaeocystis_antarctica.AAC.3